MKVKKLVCVPMLMLALTLAGCTPPDDIIIDDEVEVIEENATPIKMWMMDFEEWENKINISQRKLFNKNVNDGIQLQQTYINKNDFDDLIRSSYESKNVPDIYMVSYGNLYKEVKAGRAIALNDYLSDSVWSDLTDIAKEAITYKDSNGKSNYYGFPLVFEPSTVISYSKSMLLEYGKTDKIPTKWNDFLSLCSTIKTNLKSVNKKNIYPFGVPTGVAAAWGTWGMQVSATGGLAISDDWSTSRISEPGYKDLANLWKDLYLNGYVPLSSGEYTESVFNVGDGKAVMTTCGSWSISTIMNQYRNKIDDFGFAVMPTFDGNQDKVTATNGGWCYVVSSECKNVEKAIEVIKFLTAEDTAQTVDYFKRAYYSKSSPRKSVQSILTNESKKQNEVPQEWVDVIDQVASKAILEPIYDWNISVAVEGLIEEAAMGQDIDASIKKCDDQVKNIIKNNNLANTNPRL